MGPLLHELHARRIVLIACGAFAALPLHAAWISDSSRPVGRRYAVDDIVIRYAPNARSLPSDGTTPTFESLFVVDDPQPVSAAPLAEASAEVGVAEQHFSKHRTLRHESALKEEVIRELTSADCVHFSAHARAVLQRPLESGILLSGDQLLTLNEVLDLQHHHLGLVVLSACETAITGADVPDEVIGLPAGFLQAGARAVIASMWPVPVDATTLLMIRFYVEWRGNRLEPADALGHAQQWVRDSTNGEIATYFTDPPTTHRIPDEVAQHLWKQYVLRDPTVRPFQHPVNWAAFTLTG
jgi:CHAT domain-containing protein